MTRKSKNYYYALTKFMSIGLLVGSCIGFFMGEIILCLAIGLMIGFISGKFVERNSCRPSIPSNTT